MAVFVHVAGLASLYAFHELFLEDDTPFGLHMYELDEKIVFSYFSNIQILNMHVVAYVKIEIVTSSLLFTRIVFFC